MKRTGPKVESCSYVDSNACWNSVMIHFWSCVEEIKLVKSSSRDYFEQNYSQPRGLLRCKRYTGTLLRFHGDQLELTLFWSLLVFSPQQPRQKPISRLYSTLFMEVLIFLFSMS